jgi:NitT/TauT family transport system substrate-binding protein
MSRRRSSLALVASAALLVVACGTPGASGSPTTSVPATGTPGATPTPAGSPTPLPEPVKLTVGLGYIPSVQFAPFYLAQQDGLYADVGLEVEFQNKIDPDLITLVGQGAVDIGLGDGTSVIPAVSQGIPITYVATIYGEFPSIVFAKASSGITTPADLAGKRLGTPGRYGSGWIALQAMLGSANLTPEDLDIIEYPDFGQLGGLTQGAVDAATGFANNEPVQLELSGTAASILHVDGIVPLPGNGLIVGTSTLAAKRDAIANFIYATIQAMSAISVDPQVGLDAAIEVVPELGSAREAQLAVLQATIDQWMGPVQEAGGLGAIDSDDWTASIAYLTTLGLVPTPVTADDLLDLTLLPAS